MIQTERYTLHHGDCLDILPTLEAQSVDAIITDLPYGTTACSWDEVIPFAPMWVEVKRVLKPRGAFVTTASQPFTSKLIMSNLEWFKWEDIWHKTQATGHLNANVMPLREHENILIFCDGRINYNPQKTEKPKHNIRPLTGAASNSSCYGSFKTGVRSSAADVSFPRSVVKIANVNNGENLDHPTQKPVALLEYLIRTYTNEGDTVLDFTMGSGSTGVAAMRTGRRFVGVEMGAGYYAIAQERIANAAGEFVTTAKEAEQGKRSLFDWQAD